MQKTTIGNIAQVIIYTEDEISKKQRELDCLIKSLNNFEDCNTQQTITGLIRKLKTQDLIIEKLIKQRNAAHIELQRQAGAIIIPTIIEMDDDLNEIRSNKAL